MRIFTQFGERSADQIRSAVPGVDAVAIDTRGDLPDGLTGDALLTLAWGSPNLAAVVDRGVQWVHTIGTGVDRFPLDLIGDDVTLTCSRGASAIPIAEWVLAVMLAFEKHLPASWISEPLASWDDRPAGLGGLAGKTLGIIGFGGIARAAAVRALAFDMSVRVFRRSSAPPSIVGVTATTSLVELVTTADHLLVAAPSTRETRHLIGDEVLAAVKPGIHLVNIARGALVDQEALRRALDDGRVAMASLDTVEPEPLPAGHWLYEHPRVRLSPHISWSSPGSIEMLFDLFLDNLRRRVAGEPLVGEVDRIAGY